MSVFRVSIFFILYVLPVLIAVGGWLYALGVRRQGRRGAQ